MEKKQMKFRKYKAKKKKTERINITEKTYERNLKGKPRGKRGKVKGLPRVPSTGQFECQADQLARLLQPG